jgi:hypothetical protein
MREYITLPDQLLADARSRRAWLERSLRYVSALPPKARR